MAEIYAKYKKQHGAKFPERRVSQEVQPVASSDMGNVNYAVPTVHPMYAIRTEAPNHTKEFADAAGTEAAHIDTLEAAKCLVMPATYVLLDAQFFEAVRNDLCE